MSIGRTADYCDLLRYCKIVKLLRNSILHDTLVIVICFWTENGR